MMQPEFVPTYENKIFSLEKKETRKIVLAQIPHSKNLDLKWFAISDSNIIPTITFVFIDWARQIFHDNQSTAKKGELLRKVCTNQLTKLLISKSYSEQPYKKSSQSQMKNLKHSNALGVKTL